MRTKKEKNEKKKRATRARDFERLFFFFFSDSLPASLRFKLCTFVTRNKLVFVYSNSSLS